MHRLSARAVFTLVLALVVLSPIRALAQPSTPSTPAGAGAACATEVGFPEAIRVSEAGAGAARWLGVWEGQWKGGSDSRLVIERVEEGHAVIVYAWGAVPNGSLPAGWNRLIADLASDGTLAWGPQEGRFSFKLAAGGGSADGTLTTAGGQGSIELKRCTPDGVARFPEPSAAPPAQGAVVEDPLSSPGVLQPTECPAGRSSTTFRDGSYVLRTNGRCQENQGSAFASTGPIAGLTVPDGEVRFQAKVLAGAERLRLRIAVRADPATGGSRGYLVRIDPGRGVADLVAATSDQGTLLDARTDLQPQLTTGDWMTVSLRLRGPDIWVLLDDEPILTGRDATFTNGSLYVTALRMGDPSDNSELAVALRGLGVSRVAGAVAAREPRYSGASPAPAAGASSANSTGGAPSTSSAPPADASASGGASCSGGAAPVFEQSGAIQQTTTFCR